MPDLTPGREPVDCQATYREVGDRQAGDSVSFPRDDLVAARAADGWIFQHKDGTPD